VGDGSSCAVRLMVDDLPSESHSASESATAMNEWESLQDGLASR